MAKTQTKKVEEKKEFTLEQVFAMWKETSKKGASYFTGKCDKGYIKGFYNTNKQNPKEPDIRIYLTNDKGDLEKDVYLSLWCNTTDNGKKYLTGKLGDKRVVGFINAKANEENKQPYFTVYYSDDKKPEKVTKERPQMEEIKDEKLPF